ncbi:hypothetical protein SAMN04488005_0446 [Yoonia tamlensis]|uniref:Outer membrane protein n=1 Tax=Yoonia tamlensis TaxID=390270 RepID=A0A1I6FTE3_9RHOB|nr:Lpg1974 family pore-forming outer membrane protein [Yoonia tamlensis]SFR33168.1 hypothetical protein SAMN04488005_0446 [Yoonia tamlensis]
MRLGKLMGSVSSVAVVVAGAQQASAETQSMLSGYKLNVQGGVGVSDGVWNDKFEASSGSSGPFDKIGAEEGIPAYMGSVALSRQTSPNKDMAFGLSFGVSDGDGFSFSSSFSGSGSSGSGTLTFAGGEGLSFAALDFEMGTTVPTGMADLRWFYGARALASKSTLSEEFDKVGSSGSGSASFEFESVFLGVGPRVGVGFSTQPAPGSQFGFSGEVGAAYLFGTRTETFTSSYSSGGSSSSYSSSYSERKNVTSLDAQVGVDYYLSDNATISAGYQLQQFWNIDSVSDEDASFDGSGPRLVHGVFVGFTTQF